MTSFLKIHWFIGLPCFDISAVCRKIMIKLLSGFFFSKSISLHLTGSLQFRPSFSIFCPCHRATAHTVKGPTTLHYTFRAKMSQVRCKRIGSLPWIVHRTLHRVSFILISQIESLHQRRVDFYSNFSHIVNDIPRRLDQELTLSRRPNFLKSM